jgi:hypothetical protein
MTGVAAQAVKRLPSKPESLSSNPSMLPNKKIKKKIQYVKIHKDIIFS